MPTAAVVPDAVTGEPTQFWFYNGPGSAGLPSVGYNPTTDQSGGPDVPLGPGELMIHPGNKAATSTLLCVVRWTAPALGNYFINGKFIGLDRRGLDVTSYVTKNGDLEMNQALLGVGATSEYTKTARLNVGDTIDFLVSNNGTLGDRDWTRLNVNISAVAAPEPTSLVLLLPFAAGFLVWRKSLSMVCVVVGRQAAR